MMKILLLTLFTGIVIINYHVKLDEINDLEKDEIISSNLPTCISNDLLITCEGIGKLKFNMSYSDIVNTFGSKNVQSDTFYLSKNPELAYESLERDDRITTRVKTPYGTIYVRWTHGLKTTKIESMGIKIEDKPQYHFANGIKVGSTFEQFVKANGNEVFGFYGFGWQFGGMISIEKLKGPFFRSYPCLDWLTHFRPINDNYQYITNLLGDELFYSNQVSSQQASQIVLAAIWIKNLK